MRKLVKFLQLSKLFRSQHRKLFLVIFSLVFKFVYFMFLYFILFVFCCLLSFLSILLFLCVFLQSVPQRALWNAFGRSHQWCSIKKPFLKILQKSQENTNARVSFFSKVAGRRPAASLKKRLCHRCFPVNFAEFLKNLFQRTPSGDCLSNLGGKEISCRIQKGDYE